MRGWRASGGFGEGRHGSVNARKFANHRNAFAALRSASERFIDIGNAALLLLANCANLAIRESIAKTDVHSLRASMLNDANHPARGKYSNCAASCK